MTATAPIKTPDTKDIASVVRQADKHGWRFGFFDFGKAKADHVDYFNCSMLHRHDGISNWLITRKAEWDNRDKFGYNSLMAFSTLGVRPLMGYKIQMGYQFPHEHFEDPRVVAHDGRIFISCTNFVRSPRGMTYPHQVITEVTEDWQLVKRHDPVYGKNARDAGGNTGHEKNWHWFFYDGLPHMVYQASPHTVVRFDQKFVMMDECVTEWDSSVWEYGQIRGGSPACLVDGEYWTFFHSSTPFSANKRQYHMGAYAFEAKPPFRVTRITLEPFISGSQFDGGLPGKPPCVFPGSAQFNNNKWFITMGVNDIKCAWVEIPHANVLDRSINL